ncbi:carboxymuconolactone decarboxylase family protein [Spongiactinospora sp. TRM90649]|uniref:carboxymuconolactone decarboxylase family protein n=1 Tax=Spongiactinospora sp. TRM90649 TaxID=3031114 RepID=UPI0023F7A0C0|nr:carboxymuconolactone decarboxylase family protein [Spongiactinospora sp. TRM90649]MDF5755485.1 carboxymuconolactone decarboxylase family protein [Spongiactinospora sp. TRM90649]
MQARMKNPAMVIPELREHAMALGAAVHNSGAVPSATLHLVHLRVSQINGCGVCVDMGTRTSKKEGETDERLHAVAAWRDTACFDDGERAALALAEAVTRIADSSDPVPDHVWDAAADHFDEKGLAVLVSMIAMSNMFNRISVTTRQIAGTLH